jgi:hypothetical protein
MPELMQFAPVGEFVQARPAAARENQRDGLPREPAYKARIFHGGLVDHVTVPPQSIIVKSGRRVHRDRPEVAQ